MVGKAFLKLLSHMAMAGLNIHLECDGFYLIWLVYTCFPKLLYHIGYGFACVHSKSSLVRVD